MSQKTSTVRHSDSGFAHPDATPLLHIATPQLHNATLCYTPATADTQLQQLTSYEESTTYIPSTSAPCYTPPFTSPLEDPRTVISLVSAELNASSHPSATLATCNKAHKTLFQLTPIQRQALDLLHAGHCISATARAINVHRVTVQRWKTHHPRFIAELTQRAARDRLESSLKAQRALDLALNLLIKRLVSGKGAEQIALRLVASPRFSRLASSTRPLSLSEALKELQQTRNLDPDAPPTEPIHPIAASPRPRVAASLSSPHPSALNQITAQPTNPQPNPKLLDELLAEIDAPIPPDPLKQAKDARELALEEIRKEKQRLMKLPWHKYYPTIEERFENHPIRPDLLATFRQYGCDLENCQTAVRRPDLTPFDIHYLTHAGMGPRFPERGRQVAGYYNSGTLPAGIEGPMSPRLLAHMISAGQLTRLAGHDLTGYQPSVDPENKTLTLTHPTKPPITIPQDHLWRDMVFCETPAAPAATTTNSAG